MRKISAVLIILVIAVAAWKVIPDVTCQLSQETVLIESKIKEKPKKELENIVFTGEELATDALKTGYILIPKKDFFFKEDSKETYVLENGNCFVLRKETDGKESVLKAGTRLEITKTLNKNIEIDGTLIDIKYFSTFKLQTIKGVSLYLIACENATKVVWQGAYHKVYYDTSIKPLRIKHILTMFDIIPIKQEIEEIK